MLDGTQTARSTEGDYVEFVTTGTAVVGEFHCAGCGYGVTVHTKLPRCPMCAGTTWEQAAWSPFSRATRAARRDG
jgi:rubredoxin